MDNLENLIEEQRKENLALREKKEKEALELVAKEKAEVRARIMAELQAYADQELETDALRREYVENMLDHRLRQEAIKAGKEENYYVENAVDNGRSMIDVLKDYYADFKEMMQEKVDALNLAVDSEYAARQEQEMKKFVDVLKEGTWRRELAEDLIQNGDVKTRRQLLDAIHEYENVVESTSGKDFEAFLEKDERWYGRRDWERDYVTDLVEKGEIRTMDEALDSMIAYDKWRERNPELASVVENCQTLMNQLDKKIVDEKDMAVLAEYREESAERLEKNIAFLIKKGNIQMMEEAPDNVIVHEKWREQNPDLAFMEDFIESIPKRMHQLDEKASAKAYEQNPHLAFIGDCIKDVQARIDRLDEKIEVATDENDKVRLREWQDKSVESLEIYKKHKANLEKIEEKVGEARLERLEKSKLVKDMPENEFKEYVNSLSADDLKLLDDKRLEDICKLPIERHYSIDNEVFSKLRSEVEDRAVANRVNDAIKKGCSKDEDFERFGIVRKRHDGIERQPEEIEKQKHNIELKSKNNIMRGVKNKEGLAVKASWRENDKYLVCLVEATRDGKLIERSHNDHTHEEMIAETIKACDVSYERDRDKDRGLELSRD